MSPLRKPSSTLPPETIPDATTEGEVRLTCRLKTVTPIFGGSAKTKTPLAKGEPPRIGIIRGQLRFWWRATHAHMFSTIEEMRQREFEIWGGTRWLKPDARPEDKPQAVRSRVRVMLCQEEPTPAPTPSGVHKFVQPKNGDPGKVDRTPTWASAKWPAYALFPLMKDKEDLRNASGDVDTLPITMSMRFRLDIVVLPSGPNGRSQLVPASVSEASSVLNDDVIPALRAWLMFGGYGGRTRRGMGALKAESAASVSPGQGVAELVELWLNLNSLTQQGLRDYLRLRPRPIAGAAVGMAQVPTVFGAMLTYPKEDMTTATQAWKRAVDWLKVFRQGLAADGGPRKPDPRGKNRPSTTEMPEPARLRSAYFWDTKVTTDHLNRSCSAQAAWPRASFGLPIQMVFQTLNRDPSKTNYVELGSGKPVAISWRSGHRRMDRLASPLVVKGLQVGPNDSDFLPIALWLNVAYPAGGKLFATIKNGFGSPWSGAEADFDVIEPDTSIPVWAPLCTAAVRAEPVGKKVRRAFFDWLAPRGTVAPITI